MDEISGSKEALEYVADLTKKGQRAAMLPIPDGSQTLAIYHDGEESYSLVPRYVKRERKVSNITSFVQMLLVEAKRSENQQKGERMTVIFRSTGAEFHLDDKDARTVFKYERALSPQWKLLMDHVGRDMAHKDFVRLLQGLRPSVKDFAQIITAFRRVALSSGQRVESSPVIEQGKAGMSYALNIHAQGGLTQEDLPSQITFQMPYARGDQELHALDAEVAIDLVEKPEKRLVFALVVPEASRVIEEAVASEVVRFRHAVESLTELSILEDY